MKTALLKMIMSFFLIASLLFYALAAADSFILPSGLKTIETEAFYGDSRLEKVIIPDGAESINSRAFANTSLEYIYIPNTVSYIAQDAFDHTGSTGGPVIYGHTGSYTQAWAADNGYTFYSTSGPDPDYDPVILPWLIATVKSTSYNSLSIEWNAVESATSYTLYYDTASKGNPLSSPVSVDVGNNYQYTITGLKNNTTYHIWVIAYNSSVMVNESDEITGTTDTVIPLWEGPDITSIYSDDGTTLNIEFNEYDGATGYTVFFNDGASGDPVTMYVNAEENTHDGIVSALAWIEIMLKDHTSYAITVAAMADDQYISTESQAAYYTTDFGQSAQGGDVEELIYPTSIELDTKEAELHIGDYLELTATLTPSNVSDSERTITWVSMDTSIAAVDNGEVYAKSSGSTVISAYTSNGLYDYCQIQVVEEPKVEGWFNDNDELFIVKYGYEDQLSYHVEVENEELQNVKLVQVNSKSETTVFTNSHSGETVANGFFTISAAPGSDFRSLGANYTFKLVATLSDGMEVELDTANVEIGFTYPQPVTNVDAYYSSGKIYVNWSNNGDARRFRVIFLATDSRTPDYVDVNDEYAEEAVIPASKLEEYKTYLIYVVAYATDGFGYTSHSDPVRVTTVDSSTPGVTARFVGEQKVYAPGETIQIEITYHNVIKVHYHNGDISYNPNALQTGINNGDIGVFSSNRSGVEIVELEAQSVSGWYIVEINAKNANEVQASNFYNYTTAGNVDCLGLEYYVDTTGLEAPSWISSRSVPAVGDLLWSAVEGATGYRIWVSTTKDIQDGEATDVGNVQRYKLTGILTGKNYYVWVQAKNSTGGGTLSAMKNLLFPSTTPTVSAEINGSVSAGGQVPIHITYSNIMKIHYQNDTGTSGQIWSDSNAKEEAENNISGSQTVYLPAQDIPGTYYVTIWAKDTEGNQATGTDGYKVRYTVTGEVPRPYVTLSISPDSTNTIHGRASMRNVIWLTHTYSNTTKLVYELYKGNEKLPFTNVYYLNQLHENAKSSIEFNNIPYSSTLCSDAMSFIPSDDLKAGAYTLQVTATNDIPGSKASTATVEIIIKETDLSINEAQEAILDMASAWMNTYWDGSGLGIYSSDAIVSTYPQGTISHGAPYVGGHGCTANGTPARRTGASGNNTVYRYTLSAFKTKCLDYSQDSSYPVMLKDSGVYTYSGRGERYGALNGLECTGFALACMKAANASVDLGSTLSGQSNLFDNSTVNVTQNTAGYADYSFVIPGDAVRHSGHVRIVKENHIVKKSDGSIDIDNSYLLVYECSPSGKCLCDSCQNGLPDGTKTVASGVRMTKRTYASLANPGSGDKPYSIVTRLKLVDKDF